ncbi:hypothetical protein RhiirB3_506791, partial [Rhizophagus irregularis]
FKSDIYSIGILMWEISSGRPPFISYEHDFDLAIYIINGIRPKIVSGTPLEYKNLMIQCWDANPLNRPDIETLRKRIRELNFYYQNKSNELLTKLEEDNNLEIGDLEYYIADYLRVKFINLKIFLNQETQQKVLLKFVDF